MTKAFAPTVIAAVLAAPAMAIDLDAMSLSQRERYCIAYSFLDLEAQKQAGTIDQASYDHMRNRIVWEVFDKGDNHSYAREQREIDRAVDAILAEQPTYGEVAAQARVCHALLRL